MKYDKLIEYLNFLLNQCKVIKSDCDVTSDELMRFRSEVISFNQRIQSDENIRVEYKKAINELPKKLPSFKKLGVREKMAMFFRRKYRHQNSENIADLTLFEERLNSVLILTTEDVFINKSA